MCSSCGTPATPSSSSGSCNPIWEAGRLPALRRSVLDSVLDSAVTFLAVSDDVTLVARGAMSCWLSATAPGWKPPRLYQSTARRQAHPHSEGIYRPTTPVLIFSDATVTAGPCTQDQNLEKARATQQPGLPVQTHVKRERHVKQNAPQCRRFLADPMSCHLHPCP